MGIASFLMSRRSTSKSSAGVEMNDSAAQAPIAGIQAVTMDMDTYLASDEMEWLRYLAQTIRTYRKPGLSVVEEYRLWHSARAQSRATAAATAAGMTSNSN
jgi:hypothetical protein